MGTMKAFVMPEVGQTDMVDKPIPEPGPNDVVVKTTHALICTSDVHTVKGALPVAPGVTLGHEALGVIHAIGSAVTGFTEGQRVAVNAVTPCFECRYCQTGYTSQCGGPLGGYQYTAQRDGNMAEYFIVPHAKANVAPIPDDISSEAAVYACDMLSTGFMGAEHCYLRLGDTAAVFAQGAVGLSATIGLSLLGASRIFAVESIPNRQELSKAYGATDVIDFSEGRCCRTDPRGDRRRRCRRRDRGARLPADLGRLSAGDQGRRAGVEHRVPRREPEPAAVAARRVRPRHGRQVHPQRPVPGGNDRMQRIFALIRTGRFDPTRMTTHTFEFDEVRRRLPDDAEQGGRHHQAADHLLSDVPESR